MKIKESEVFDQLPKHLKNKKRQIKTKKKPKNKN